MESTSKLTSLIIFIIVMVLIGTNPCFSQVLPNKKNKPKDAILYDYQDIVSKVTFTPSEITSGTVKTLNLLPDPSSNCVPRIYDGEFYAVLKIGIDDYEFGLNSGSINDSIRVIIYSNNNSSQCTIKTQTQSKYLSLKDLKKPESCVKFENIKFYCDNNVDHPKFLSYNVRVQTIYSFTSSPAIINNNVVLEVFYTSKNKVHSRKISNPSSPIIESIKNLNTNYPEKIIQNGVDPIRLQWKYCSECTYDSVMNFEVQVLKLNNTNESYAGELSSNWKDVSYNPLPKLYCKVDWSRAITFETGSKKTHSDIILSEGSGYYIWRVRPIGNLFDAGRPDGISPKKSKGYNEDRNYGEWVLYKNSTGGEIRLIKDGDIIDSESSGNEKDCAGFFYLDNDGEKNWRHTRFYSENWYDGIRFLDVMDHADELNNLIQTKKRISSTDHIITEQTILDNEARPALKTLPVPLKDIDGITNISTGIEYRDGLLKNSSGSNYSAEDYDMSNSVVMNYLSPGSSGSTSLINEYYDGDVNLGSNLSTEYLIPSAMGYPFYRTVFSNDGTNRVIEQSSPGDVHKLVVDAFDQPNSQIPSRTNKTLYASANSQELIPLFGDESPEEGTISKVINVDPNGVVSVSYNNKSGKTIATCLSTTNAYGEMNLESLDDEVLTVQNEVKLSSGEIFSEGHIIDFEDIAITNISTTLNMTYQVIPPRLDFGFCFNDSCYQPPLDVNIRIIDPSVLSSDENYIIDENNIQIPENRYVDCSITPSSQTFTYQNIINKPGKYKVYKDVSVQKGYLDGILSRVEEAIQDELLSSPGGEIYSVWEYLNDQENFELDYFYDEILADPNNGWVREENVDYDESDKSDGNPQYVYKKTLECCEFIIPEIRCSEESCDSDLSDCLSQSSNTTCFENYLFDTYEKNREKNPSYPNLDSNLNNYFYRYLSGYNSTNDKSLYCPSIIAEFNNPTITIDPDNANGAFSILIQNMRNFYLDNARVYLDDDLCQAWKKAVQIFLIDGFKRDTVGVLILEDNEYVINQEFDLLETFMRLIGKSYKGISNRPYSLDNPNQPPIDSTHYGWGYLSHAHLYFRYEKCGIKDNRKDSCEFHITESGTELVKYYDEMSNYLNDQSCTFTNEFKPFGVGYSDSPRFVDPQDYYNEKKWEQLDECLSKEQFNSLVEKSGETISNPEDTTNFYNMVNECFTFCEKRFDEFYNRLVDAIHLKWWIVEGEEYFLTPVANYNNNGIDKGVTLYKNHSNFPTTVVNTQTIAAAANKLVEHCSESCEFDYNPPDSVSNDAFLAMINVMTKDFEIEFNDTCGSGWETIKSYAQDYPYNFTSIACEIRDSLNAEISRIVAEYDSCLNCDVCQYDKESRVYDNFMNLFNISYDVLKKYRIYGCYDFEKVDFEKKIRQDNDSCYNIYQPSANYYPLEYWNNPADYYKFALYVFRPDTTLYFNDSTHQYSSLYWHYFCAADVYGCTYGGYNKHIQMALNQAGWYKVDTAITYVNNTIDVIPIHFHDPDSLQFCFRWIDREEPDPEDIVQEIRPCDEIQRAVILGNLNEQINKCIDINIEKAKSKFYDEYFKSQHINDNLVINWVDAFYHYTLYYYDRAGNLVKTVPPGGVDFVTSRANHPEHQYSSCYKYNSLGQIIEQSSPDELDSLHPSISRTLFIYDKYNRIKFSQSTKQSYCNPNQRYSYTIYDDLGRIIETGEAELQQGKTIADLELSAKGVLVPAVNFPDPNLIKSYIKTVYTTSTNLPAPFQLYQQRNLRNRISHTIRDHDGQPVTGGNIEDQTITYYSYDPHGNVDWIIQSVPLFNPVILGGVPVLTSIVSIIKYEYDLITGNILKVSYNEGAENGFNRDYMSDSYHQRYFYDEDNRLTRVESSRFGEIWDRDAKYSYYQHGPLKRVELGEDRVQGVDYQYTINGWLKSINGQDPSLDPGADASTATGAPNMKVPPDDFSSVIDYHLLDFIHDANMFGNSLLISQPGKSLFNGNIAATEDYFGTGVNNTMLTVDGAYKKSFGAYYQYDVLNRLLSANHKYFNSGVWTATNTDNSTYSYDPNGNLTSLTRSDKGGAPLDNLSYIYKFVNDSGYTYKTNRLDTLIDAVGSTTVPYDLEGGGVYKFYYDRDGNLATDQKENLSITEWTPDGKIRKASKTRTINNGTNTFVQELEISYFYDALGRRVGRDFKFAGANQCLAAFPNWETGECRKCRDELLGIGSEYYLRDANGETMAIYGTIPKATDCFPLVEGIKLKEWDIYGSEAQGRIAVHEPIAGEQVLYQNAFIARPEPQQRVISGKGYELKDHLGNVRVVVKDVKEPVDPNTRTQFYTHYREISDYYPFGMLMEGRNWQSYSERYGYNGMEQDDYMKENNQYLTTNPAFTRTGTGNAYTTEFRELDTRIGRWLSRDPVFKEWESPYAGFGNNPVLYIDPRGDVVKAKTQPEFELVAKSVEKKYESAIKINPQTSEIVLTDEKGIELSTEAVSLLIMSDPYSNFSRLAQLIRTPDQTWNVNLVEGDKPINTKIIIPSDGTVMHGEFSMNFTQAPFAGGLDGYFKDIFNSHSSAIGLYVPVKEDYPGKLPYYESLNNENQIYVKKGGGYSERTKANVSEEEALAEELYLHGYYDFLNIDSDHKTKGINEEAAKVQEKANK